ncbi:uncharacterized protein LOC130988974 [Salvia miltiorrhiza]|uniref:uncharacterized protein LOC130988974 n=1 Tax=Salvia miltiorrhiza TaxID=226208 RepID=UPI0025AD01F5|nr:uncharacterized protein LOC130988974 [Salvia miltiorrhiza]
MEKKKKGPKPSRLQEEEVNNNSFDGSGGNSKRRNSSDKMENEKRAATKRGRPHKQQRRQEEDLNNTTFDCAAANINASFSSQGHESASLDQPRPRTRFSMSFGKKKAAVSSQSRIPPHSIGGNSSENSSLLLVKQILFESNSMDKANHVALEAKDTHSELESISPDEVVEAQKGMDPRKNVLDLQKFTSELLAQTQQPELSFQAGEASSCSDDLMVNNSLLEREANVVPNISARANENPTTTPTRSKSPQKHDAMSDSGDAMIIDVEGYKVKKEVAPLLKAIFNKYGDIAKESSFSTELRSSILDLVCTIYKRLEGSKLMQLTALELESMLGQIGDLKLVKVDVGWLHERLEQISKARQLYDGASTLEDLKARSVGVICEKQRAVQKCEEELQACMAEAMKLQERLHQEKEELDAARTLADQIHISGGSLVWGLV